MADDELLWESARALYALPLPDFIAGRKVRAAQARDAGDRPTADRVARLAKPSAGASLVNRLLRQEPDLAGEVDELGMRLRAAQASAEPAELRSVDAERRALVNRCGERARDVASAAGESVSGTTIEAVEQTIWAALVDATAAATVRAGVLVRALSPSGFGEVDTAGASALPVDAPAVDGAPRARRTATKATSRARASAPARRRDADRAQVCATKQAADLLARAQASHRDAQTEVDRASQAVDRAAAERADLERERDDLTERLAAVGQRLRASKAATGGLRADLRDAERERRAAAADLDRAARGAEELGSGS